MYMYTKSVLEEKQFSVLTTSSGISSKNQHFSFIYNFTQKFPPNKQNKKYFFRE